MSSTSDQYARQAGDWTETAYADATAYLAHRADLIATLGPRLEPGDEVLDLACGDAGYRHYCEDIDLCYRAMRAGWERWYVPSAIVTHDYAAVIDRRFLSRHTLWHARGMARFVRKHPERLLAL